MAKSLGNTIAPSAIIKGGKDPRANPAFGVDVLSILNRCLARFIMYYFCHP